jgi:hypothetical protein
LIICNFFLDNNGSSQTNEKKEDQQEDQSDEKADKNDVDDDDDDDKQLKYTYSWYQEGDDVTVSFDVADGTTKDDVVCIIKPDEIEVSLFSGESLLKGPLFAKVKAGESTWTLNKNW